MHALTLQGRCQIDAGAGATRHQEYMRRRDDRGGCPTDVVSGEGVALRDLQLGPQPDHAGLVGAMAKRKAVLSGAEGDLLVAEDLVAVPQAQACRQIRLTVGAGVVGHSDGNRELLADAQGTWCAYRDNCGVGEINRGNAGHVDHNSRAGQAMGLGQCIAAGLESVGKQLHPSAAGQQVTGSPHRPGQVAPRRVGPPIRCARRVGGDHIGPKEQNAGVAVGLSREAIRLGAQGCSPGRGDAVRLIDEQHQRADGRRLSAERGIGQGQHQGCHSAHAQQQG